MRDESFYGELKRVKRGVRLAWILDFLMLVVVFDALAIVFFLSMDSSHKDIARFHSDSSHSVSHHYDYHHRKIFPHSAQCSKR